MIRGGDSGRIRASEARCPVPGHLFELFLSGRRTRRRSKRILVTNPVKLYGFPN